MNLLTSTLAFLSKCVTITYKKKRLLSSRSLHITGLTNNLQTKCWLISVQEMHGRRTAKETDQRHFTGKLKMEIDI